MVLDENVKELRYPTLFKSDKKETLNISFRDIPDANLSGVNIDEALKAAQQAIVVALIYRLTNGQRIPTPSKLKKHEYYIGVPDDFLHKAIRYTKRNAEE